MTAAVRFIAKRPLIGRMVRLLPQRSEQRRLTLLPDTCWVLVRHGIHELIATDDRRATPGVTVDRVAYLGFCEITRGGVIAVGDRLLTRGRDLGSVSGFELNHYPDHLNILLTTSGELVTGLESGMRLGQVLSIEMATGGDESTLDEQESTL